MLYIFPPGMAYPSVFFTVWLSAITTIFFNLRLGWVVAGMVVPGYIMVTYFLQSDITLTILIEAIITFFLVLYISDYCGKYRYWYGFIGKESFYLTLIIAILVQLICDHYIFPFLSTRLMVVSTESSLFMAGMHSFGIVIIALTANIFYRGGFPRSFFQLIVIMFIIYLLIRFLLLPYTNFNFNRLAQHYIEMGAYIAATPKRFIILVMTATIAMYYNYQYAWRYNGILIPALLALEWFSPATIVISICEAVIIFAIARIIYIFHIIPQSKFDGASKYGIIFTITLIYKILFYLIFHRIYPNIDILHYYGFGYLLTTLIAIKIFDYNPALRVTRSLIQVLILAIIVANLLGYTLTAIGSPLHVLVQSETQFYREPPSTQKINPNFENFLHKIVWLKNKPSNQDWTILSNEAKKLGFQMTMIDQQTIWITSRDLPIQFSLMVNLNPHATPHVIIARMNKMPTILGFYAGDVFLKKNAKALLLMTQPPNTHTTIGSMLNYYNLEKQINRAIAPLQHIVIRYHSELSNRCDIPRSTVNFPAVVKGVITVNLCQMLQKFYPDLYQSASFKILTHQSLSAYINNYFNEPDHVAKAGNETYQPLTADQLTFFDFNVLTPLIRAINQPDFNSNANNLYLHYFATNMNRLHYELVIFNDAVNKAHYMVLQPTNPKKNFHGLLILNAAAKSPYLFELPYPDDTLCNISVGKKLFESLQGKALILNTASANTNLDQSADVLFFYNKNTLFNLKHQTILRENPSSQLLPIQIIPIIPNLFEPKTTDDFYLAFKKNAWEKTQLNPLQQQLYHAITSLHFSVHLVQGDLFSRGYEVKNDAQSRYTPLSTANDFSYLFFTPALLNKLSILSHSDRNLKIMRALNIQTIEANLNTFLRNKQLSYSPSIEAYKTTLIRYQETHQISVLYSLLQAHPELSLTYVYQSLCNPAYLIFFHHKKIVLIAAVDLFARGDEVITQSNLTSDVLNQFTQGERQWLYLRD